VTTRRLAKFAATLITLSVLLFILAAAQLAVAQLTIGSSNTATAVPPIPRPSTTPCGVSLFSGFIFDNYNAQSFTYTPPADCPAPWAKVILKASFSISAGIQYDRTANIWIGDTNIYFGTTAEDQPDMGRNWQVERDLTDYSSLFTVAQDGAVDLGNTVNSSYTGVLHGSAELLFFPLAPKQTAPRVADQVIGFSSGPTGGTVGLGSPTSLLEQTLTLPTNISTVFFDVFAQGQSSNDEFWYTCVPNDVATELESCGNTAFRESEVTIDGTPAGVAPIYPWIFTGGIDPYLWIPIPGVQTLNFQPYRVDLTPFASLLDDGNPHTIALSVFDTTSYFSATASLLLYLDSNATTLTGAVTENTLTAPVPTVTENLHTAPNGNISGTVKTTSGHNFQISGYLNTSAGPVTTTVAQDINFNNLQDFLVQQFLYVQDISQDTTIHSVVTTKNANGTYINDLKQNWPLTVNISETVNSDGSGTQTTSINQYLEKNDEAKHNGQPTSTSLLENRVISTDALDFNSQSITGNQNQSSSQDFFTANSTGYCYSRDITAANNVLTGITNGTGCN
jgi:Peptide N-acetyl-beta-D-glucosaminyl asparaginase amidase A